MIESRARLLWYLALGIGLVLIRLFVSGGSWTSSPEFHTLIEAVSAFAGVIVAAVAMLRFYARKSMHLLLSGVAFGGAAFADAAHAAVTSSFALGYAHAWPVSLLPWSWFLGRVFLGALLAARAWTWARPDARPLQESRVFAITAALAVLSVAVVFSVPLPPALFPDQLLARPQELVPAALLSYALAVHLRIGAWKADPFEHSLIISMILGVAAQGLFMVFSAAPHDAMFDIAHVLKLLSMSVVLVGLLVGTFGLFRVAERDYEERTFGFLDNLPVGVFILEGNGNPYYSNRKANELLGKSADPNVSPEDLSTAYKIYVIGSDEEYPPDRLPVVRALHGELTTVADMEIRHAGETIPIQASGASLLGPDGRVAYAICAFQDIRELRRTALQDPLTGLANRLAFHESYGRTTGLTWRAEQSVCVALIDLDRFKGVNDTYGHEMGDVVLRRASDIILQSMRTTDLVARWGGEEIVVLLPGATLAGAVLAIERALERMRKETFCSDAKTFSVTFSAGVVVVPNGTAAERAVAEADCQLYKAKGRGRNRVCSPADNAESEAQAHGLVASARALATPL